MRLGQDKIDDCEAANDILGVHSSLSATQLIVGDDERDVEARVTVNHGRR